MYSVYIHSILYNNVVMLFYIVYNSIVILLYYVLLLYSLLLLLIKYCWSIDCINFTRLNLLIPLVLQYYQFKFTSVLLI